MVTRDEIMLGITDALSDYMDSPTFDPTFWAARVMERLEATGILDDLPMTPEQVAWVRAQRIDRDR